jgi:hypothetical protein
MTFYFYYPTFKKLTAPYDCVLRSFMRRRKPWRSMVGASGIEPLTLATSKQCSTTELRALDLIFHYIPKWGPRLRKTGNIPTWTAILYCQTMQPMQVNCLHLHGAHLPQLVVQDQKDHHQYISF